MPAYLSDGSRQYNQMRRIHPRDSVSQLDYYLSSSSNSSNSSTARFSNNNSDVSLSKHNDSDQSQELDDKSSSSYSFNLSQILARRHRPTDDVEQKKSSYNIKPINQANLSWTTPDNKLVRQRRKKQSDTVDEPKITGVSPFNSSGFSEGTLVDQTTYKEYFDRPAHQVQLQEHNSRSFKTRLQSNLSSNQLRYVKNHPVDKQQSLTHQIVSGRINATRAASPAGYAHLSRVKRRNISRHNRRMILSGESHLNNSYALSELFSQSEIPGFREIFASDSYLRKFCWIVAFLFMTILSLNDMTELITEYYDYPITVDVRLRDSSRLPFPAVTVCNLNVVRFSALCSSSNIGLRSDLNNQIPSELREKLCGIQVEKKNTSDSDLSDINNIGITTTTATTTTTTTTTTPSSTIHAPTSIASETLQTNDKRPLPEEDDLAGMEPTNRTTTPWAQMATSLGIQWRQSTTTVDGEQAEHKIGTSSFPSTQTSGPVRKTVANNNGALDLGDFSVPLIHKESDMQQLVNRNNQSKAGTRLVHKRSIRLDEFESNESKQRPFASVKSRIRVLSSGASATDFAHPQSRPAISNEKVQSHHALNTQHASQFNQQSVNIQHNQPNRVNNQQPNSIRNGISIGPGSVTMNNAFQNPLLNNLAQSTAPTTPIPQIVSTTFVPPALPEDFELTERQERELQENLTNWLAVMYNRDPQLTWSLGHQFDDMILRCTMKSINCTHQRSFENSFRPTEGNCFTYRSKVRRRSNSVWGTKGSAMFDEANLAGTNHGLELVLNLEKNEYISGSSQVGALVMIHHPSDLGYAASEATFVAPEFTTYIGLKMVNITRLPAPYPEYCIDSWPAKFADTLTRNSTYSQQACIKICLQKTIQNNCQCQSAFLPIVELDSQTASLSSASVTAVSSSSSSSGGNSSSGEDDSRTKSNQASSTHQQPEQRIIICDTRKLVTRQCVKEVMFRAADRVHNCECPPKCQVVRYDKTISMARWPTREDKVTFDRGKMDVNFQNLAKVIVYFQTMTCEEVTQQAVFNAAKLFSALGGIMGMYVGFSFLSVFEIFEVMSRKMWHHFTVKIANTTSRMVNNFRS